MFGLNSHDKIHDATPYLKISSGGRTIPINATTDLLNSLGGTIDFIDTWLKVLVYNISWHFRAYQENMKELFYNIP